MIPRELPPFNEEQRRSREIADKYCDETERAFHEFLNKALQKVIKEKKNERAKPKH